MSAQDREAATEEAAAAIVLHDEQKEEFKNQVTRWRGLWVATFIAFSITLIFFLVILLILLGANRQREGEIAELTKLSEHTNRSLNILERATSPEAQASRGEVINRLVVEIDCNNREAIQSLIDQLDLSEGVTVLKPECKEE